MDLAITAAMQGLGVAMADETLVAGDLRTGRLCRPFSLSVKNRRQLPAGCSPLAKARPTGWRAFAPRWLIQRHMMLHHPTKQRQPRAHKAVLDFKSPRAC